MMAAQMAYHNAMMAMSQNGSQAGGGSPDRPSSPASIGPGGQGGSGFGYGGYPFPGSPMGIPGSPMGMPGSPMGIPGSPMGMPGYGWPMWGGSGAASPGLNGMPPPNLRTMSHLGMPGMPGSYGGSNEYLAAPGGHPAGGWGTPYDARSERSRAVSSASRDGRGVGEERGRPSAS